ncbi:MAG: ribonuclease HIII [Candidatus Gastranaerophilaceae bacterium]
MNIFSEKVPTNKQEAIKDFILQNFAAIVNPKQYAFWEIKHKDFTATFYNSSKFVVQGKNIGPLLDCLSAKFDNFREIGNRELVIGNSQFTIPHYQLPYVGTDESGKGDFFGPLVVAGVLVDEKNRPLFKDLGIKDSKTLKDEQMLRMAQQIQKHSVFSVVVISNAKYNELYAKFKNLNKLLAWGHARVIENILEKTQCEYALSDKFGDESLIQSALMQKGKTIKLEQRVRAESDIAVAAASVLARATFVQKMKSMENFYGCKFPKGANDGVKVCAKDFIQKYGKDRLIEVCKVHFKTYKEI